MLDRDGQEKYFKCNSTMEKHIYSMPSIYLIIGGYGFRLKPEDLFEKDGKEIKSIIRFINEDEDLWILGIPFFREYQILFDYNRTRVGFKGENIMNYKEHYDKWVIDTAEKNSKLFYGYTQETIAFIIGTIVGICIIFYVTFWLYRNWRRGTNKYFVPLDELADKTKHYN